MTSRGGSVRRRNRDANALTVLLFGLIALGQASSLYSDLVAGLLLSVVGGARGTLLLSTRDEDADKGDADGPRAE